MLKIAICDDNGKFLEHIHQLISDEFAVHTKDFLITDYSVGELLFLRHISEPYDVIFLDIDMPNMTGFDLAAKLQEINKKTCVIFVSNHSELVFDSFYFQPLNFIIKDSDDAMRESLRNVVAQLFEKIKQEKKIVLKGNAPALITICLNDILYIESSKHYIIYHLTDFQKIKIRESMSDAEEKYAELDFIRIHKRYLANLKHIFNIDMQKSLIVFKQGFTLQISRYYMAETEKKLTEFLRKN